MGCCLSSERDIAGARRNAADLLRNHSTREVFPIADGVEVTVLRDDARSLVGVHNATSHCVELAMHIPPNCTSLLAGASPFVPPNGTVWLYEGRASRSTKMSVVRTFLPDLVVECRLLRTGVFVVLATESGARAAHLWNTTDSDITVAIPSKGAQYFLLVRAGALRRLKFAPPTTSEITCVVADDESDNSDSSSSCSNENPSTAAAECIALMGIELFCTGEPAVLNRSAAAADCLVLFADASVATHTERLELLPGSCWRIDPGLSAGQQSVVLVAKFRPVTFPYLRHSASAHWAAEAKAARSLLRRDISQEQLLRQCVDKGVAFVDLEFPPSRALTNEDEVRSTVVWRRPDWGYEIPGTVAAYNIRQGSLGDCWLLSTLAVLSESASLLQRCLLASRPEDRYAGCFQLQLCVAGWWRVVCTDDFLPFALNGAPAFGHCAKHRDLWVPLFEKVFAKVYGGYRALSGGSISHALADLTGFPCKKVLMQTQDSLDGLWSQLNDWHQQGFPMAAGTPGVDDFTETGAEILEEYDGLVPGHAFSILQVCEWDGNRLIQLRNPWGSLEWTGDWGDSSPKWTDKAREDLNFTEADDGIFWMALEDFHQRFQALFTCLVHPHWSDLRVSGSFQNGLADFYIEVVPSQSIDAISMLQQSLLPQQREAQIELGLFVIDHSLESVLEMAGFAKQRDVFTEFSSAHPILVIPATSDPTKRRIDFVLSLLGSAAVRVNVRRLPPELLSLAYEKACARFGKSTAVVPHKACSLLEHVSQKWWTAIAVNDGSSWWHLTVDFSGSTGCTLLGAKPLVVSLTIPPHSSRLVGTILATRDDYALRSSLQWSNSSVDAFEMEDIDLEIAVNGEPFGLPLRVQVNGQESLAAAPALHVAPPNW